MDHKALVRATDARDVQLQNIKTFCRLLIAETHRAARELEAMMPLDAVDAWVDNTMMVTPIRGMYSDNLEYAEVHHAGSNAMYEAVLVEKIRDVPSTLQLREAPAAAQAQLPDGTVAENVYQAFENGRASQHHVAMAFVQLWAVIDDMLSATNMIGAAAPEFASFVTDLTARRVPLATTTRSGTLRLPQYAAGPDYGFMELRRLKTKVLPRQFDVRSDVKMPCPVEDNERNQDCNGIGAGAGLNGVCAAMPHAVAYSTELHGLARELFIRGAFDTARRGNAEDLATWAFNSASAFMDEAQTRRGASNGNTVQSPA